MIVLLDVNLSPLWAEAFLTAGFDTRHWRDIGPTTASDDEIIAWAMRFEAVIVTHDLGFSRALAMARRSGPSVVQMRFDRLSPDIHRFHVVEAMRRHRAALAKGAIVTIDAEGSRFRLLPLR